MGKFTEFKLPLKSMPVGVHKFEYQLGKQFFVNMENNDVRNADLHVDLTVDHRNDVYDLNFVITGEVTVGCDRCLDDLQLPIDTAYHIIVKYGDEYRQDTDDLMEIPENDSYLNVSYIIYDTVVLAIPIKHVHPLGKCNRSMSAILKRHRAVDSEDAELADELIDEIDNIDAAGGAPDSDGNDDSQASDSRWDKLRDINFDE